MRGCSPLNAPPRLSYTDARPLVRSGDLLLCQGSSVFARLIRHATNSPWSHVGCLLEVAAIARLLVLESVESVGVRAVPLSSYVTNYNASGAGYPGRVFLGRHQAFAPDRAPAFTAFCQRAIDLLGAAYDTASIVRIAARVLAVDLGGSLPALGQNAAYICSEYVWEIYQAFGITVPYDPRGYIAPRDWAEATEVRLLCELDVT